MAACGLDQGATSPMKALIAYLGAVERDDADLFSTLDKNIAEFCSASRRKPQAFSKCGQDHSCTEHDRLAAGLRTGKAKVKTTAPQPSRPDKIKLPMAQRKQASG